MRYRSLPFLSDRRDTDLNEISGTTTAGLVRAVLWPGCAPGLFSREHARCLPNLVAALFALLQVGRDVALVVHGLESSQGVL